MTPPTTDTSREAVEAIAAEFDYEHRILAALGVK